MTRPVICAPLLTEYVALRRGLRQAGASGRVRLVRTGMGPRRSRRQRVQVPHEDVSALLVAGVAGALNAALRPGDVIVATAVHDRSGRHIECSSPSVLVSAVGRLGVTVHAGPVMCTSRLGGERSRRRLAASGAMAVEMESIDLAEHAQGAPFAVLRVIVDTPDAPLLRLGTIGRGVAALRVLRRCAPAIAEWISTVDPAYGIPGQHVEGGRRTEHLATYRENAAGGVEPTPREVS